MNAIALLEDLARRGIHIEARGDRLRLAPASAVSPELRLLLLQHKSELLACLSVTSSRPACQEETSLSGRERLWGMLNTWSRMIEDEWTQAAVDRLKDDILDVFAAHPGEADGWYRAWRAANRVAKLM